MKKISIVLIGILCAPALALAYTDAWVTGATTSVAQPQRATAHFGQLKGEPHVFAVSSDAPLRLYVQVMQPDIESAKRDLSVAIIDPRNPEIPLGVILGDVGTWTPMSYEGNPYILGPAYRATLPAGSYEIHLWSSNNDAPFALIVGEREPSVFARLVPAFQVLPAVNAEFFGHSRLHILAAPIMLIPLLVALGLVALGYWYWRRRIQ